MWQKIEIEDTSDCETCTKRDEGVLEMLAQVKCDVLTDLQCPECGRTYNLFVHAVDNLGINGGG